MAEADRFAAIARSYDRINRILSLGQEQAWRRRGIAWLPAGRILDLGSGTGAANSALVNREIVALDPSFPMLALNAAPGRVAGLGERLPFTEGSFDGVFSAYVFRNLDSVPATLSEIHRVLRQAGVAVVIDLARPQRPLMQKLHRSVSRVLVPAVGATIGARAEYEYLHHSLDKFPDPKALYANGPLRLEHYWRMGPLGFVYGVVLSKGPRLVA